jgi:hypothetical protein
VKTLGRIFELSLGFDSIENFQSPTGMSGGVETCAQINTSMVNKLYMDMKCYFRSIFSEHRSLYAREICTDFQSLTEIKGKVTYTETNI